MSAKSVVAPTPLQVDSKTSGAASDEAAALEQALAEARGMLERARTGYPVVRPQAAARFASMGEVAQRVLEEAASEPGGLAALGPDVLANVGPLFSGELRELVRSAAVHLDFPWRPALVTGLGAAAEPADRATFHAALGDPLAAVRSAAVAGLAKLEPKHLAESADLLQPVLVDRDGGVRLEAALLLDSLGQPGALATALEELRRADTFFEVPTGTLARRVAARRLTERLAGTGAAQLFGYEPRNLPTEGPNVEALPALEAFLRERAGEAWPASLPAHVLGGAIRVEGPLGLELRSCRAGEMQLAITAEDVLLIGSGSPVAIELPEGTGADLIAAMSELPERLGDDVFGRPGCDLERFRVQLPGDERPRNIHVLKGAEPVPDLRPAALDELAAAWLNLFPAEGSNPEIDSQRERLATLFDSIGGTL